MKLKKIGLFLLGECVLYISYHVVAQEGHQAFKHLQKECARAQHELYEQKKILKAYDKQLQDWYDYPYFKEQILRDDLHYAYPDEELFHS